METLRKYTSAMTEGKSLKEIGLRSPACLQTLFTLFFGTGLVVLMIWLIGLLFFGVSWDPPSHTERLDYAIVNADQSFVGALVVDAFLSGKAFDYHVYPSKSSRKDLPSIEEMESRIEDAEYWGVLYIPENYTQELLRSLGGVVEATPLSGGQKTKETVSVFGEAMTLIVDEGRQQPAINIIRNVTASTLNTVDYHLRLQLLAHLLSGNRLVGLPPPVTQEKTKTKRSVEEEHDNDSIDSDEEAIARLVKIHFEEEMKRVQDSRERLEDEEMNYEGDSERQPQQQSSTSSDNKGRVARDSQGKKQKQKPLFCNLGSATIDVSVLAKTMRLTEDNLHPASPNGFVLSTALGILFLFLISSSSSSLVFNGVQPLHAAKVKGWQIACCRVAHGMFNALMISLSFSLCVIAFGADIENGFMAFWMWCWLLSAVWGAFNAMLGIWFGPFAPLVSILALILNFTSGSPLVAIELGLSRFYEIGHALPMFNAIQGIRHIAFGSYNNIQTNAGVLLGWFWGCFILVWIGSAWKMVNPGRDVPHYIAGAAKGIFAVSTQPIRQGLNRLSSYSVRKTESDGTE